MEQAKCAGKTGAFPSNTVEANHFIAHYCRSCPVIKQCGDYAAKLGEDQGIWGGKLLGRTFTGAGTVVYESTGEPACRNGHANPKYKIRSRGRRECSQCLTEQRRRYRDRRGSNGKSAKVGPRAKPCKTCGKNEFYIYEDKNWKCRPCSLQRTRTENPQHIGRPKTAHDIIAEYEQSIDRGITYREYAISRGYSSLGSFASLLARNGRPDLIQSWSSRPLPKQAKG